MQSFKGQFGHCDHRVKVQKQILRHFWHFITTNYLLYAEQANQKIVFFGV